jgi:hypothetical protein
MVRSGREQRSLQTFWSAAAGLVRPRSRTIPRPARKGRPVSKCPEVIGTLARITKRCCLVSLLLGSAQDQAGCE